MLLYMVETFKKSSLFRGLKKYFKRKFLLPDSFMFEVLKSSNCINGYDHKASLIFEFFSILTIYSEYSFEPEYKKFYER